MFDFSQWLVSAVPTFAVIAPVVAAAYYLGLPILIRSSWRMAAHPDFKVLDLRAIEPAVAHFLAGHATPRRYSNSASTSRRTCASPTQPPTSPAT